MGTLLLRWNQRSLSNINEDLWKIIANQNSAGGNAVGTDVQISCSDGKISLHQVALRKFTNILDFATSDEVHQLKDPWGTLTLVVPHLKMEVLTTLGEFIYRGETGKVSNAALQNVLAFIRPEFGGSMEVIPQNVQDWEGKALPKNKARNKTSGAKRKPHDEVFENLPLNGTDIGSQTKDKTYLPLKVKILGRSPSMTSKIENTSENFVVPPTNFSSSDSESPPRHNKTPSLKTKQFYQNDPLEHDNFVHPPQETFNPSQTRDQALEAHVESYQPQTDPEKNIRYIADENVTIECMVESFNRKQFPQNMINAKNMIQALKSRNVSLFWDAHSNASQVRGDADGSYEWNDPDLVQDFVKDIKDLKPKDVKSIAMNLLSYKRSGGNITLPNSLDLNYMVQKFNQNNGHIKVTPKAYEQVMSKMKVRISHH